MQPKETKINNQGGSRNGDKQSNASVSDGKEKVKVPEEKQQPKPCMWFMMSWVIFFCVFVVYGGLWAIDRYAVKIQTSSYYGVSFPVSQYISSNQTYTNSTAMFTESIRGASSVAMHIIYGWLMWKFPLFVFLFEMVSDQKHKVYRFVPWAIILGLTLIGDVLLTIFLIQGDNWTWNYTDWMFYTCFFLVALITVGVGNKDNNAKSAVLTTVYLLLFIALMYASYTILLPGLYWVYVQNVTAASPFLQIYLFPLFDLIFYVMLLVGNAKISEKAKSFASSLHFLQLGYFVGMTMLVGVTEVEFYYLIAYMIFRNFFVNRVMWDWQGIVNNPACLSGWPLYYYLSYLLNTSFIIGLGRLVISKSFFTQNLALVPPLLYSIQSSLYTHSTTVPADDINVYNYNRSLQGQIYWVSGIVIWVASTLSQKYSKEKPSPYNFFYYMIGVYFFYIGLMSALNIGEEGRYAFS